MKIVICFYGEPRYAKETWYNWWHNVINLNNVEYIFTHFYLDESNTGVSFKLFDYSQPEVIIDNDIDKFIKERIGGQGFKKDRKDIFDLEEKYSGEEGAPNGRKMFYSMWKVNEMKKEYEINHNINFDCVILSRIDMNITQPIVIKDLDLLKLNVRNSLMEYEADWITISNSKNIDNYTTIWNNFPNLCKSQRFHNEELITRNCNNLGLPFIRNWDWLYIYGRK